MSATSSKPRTNSRAFAKTDCHTCAASQRRCDRRRPRCSFCTGKDTVCGGFPVQLIWPKSKPTPAKAKVQEHTDDPFRINPLSLQTSIRVSAGDGQLKPRLRRRKFKFIAESVPTRKQASPEIHKASIERDPTHHGDRPDSTLLRGDGFTIETLSPCASVSLPFDTVLSNSRGERIVFPAN